MAAKTLSPQNKALLDTAAHARIEADLALVRGQWADQRWIASGNRYRTDCINRLETDDRQQRSPTHGHLREYIAASILTHCADGWSYLGRALHAHLRGDPDCCRHLAYYAELRAAMAVLAAGGIGVFLNRHVVVDARGRCHLVKDFSTHEFTWLALEHWAATQGAGDLVLTAIRPGGIPLRSWLSAFSAGPGNQAVLTRAWLLTWGLDLERFTKDRRARNQSSYRPTAFSARGAAALTDLLPFVGELWRLNEPLGALAFARLDRHLLRCSISEAFKVMKGRTPGQAPKKFSSNVAALLNSLPTQPLGLSVEQWQSFLCYESDPDPSVLLREARGKAGALDPNHPRQLMARATLLLRVASGVVKAGLGSIAGVDIGELGFWWSRMGEDRCLWGQGEAPQDFSDLWADVEEALYDMEEWQAKPENQTPSYSMLWRDAPGPAACLGSCERMALWGLGL